ncbi:hypothetical protein LTS18_002807, partial [Coniosporium uncinatum]
LGVERWALAHPVVLERARRAFQSSIRAYATHVAAERRYFDLKQLHLGHLAKAFGLRDRPGSINVPGMRPGVGEGGKKGDRRATVAAAAGGGGGTRKSGKPSEKEGAGGVGDGEERVEMTDEQEARRKMRMMSRKAMGGASEFNLG